MDDFKDESILMAMTHDIEFQLRKHGNYGPFDNVEDVVNAMTNFELLTRVAEYLESQRTL